MGHTDFTCHAMMTKEIQAIYDINHELFDDAEEMYGESGGESFPSAEVAEFFKGAEAKKLLRNMILHFCDISNCMKDWDVAIQWAHRTQEEFLCQGDQEKELGLPVQPYHDRDKANLPYSQRKWIDEWVDSTDPKPTEEEQNKVRERLATLEAKR